MKFVHLIGLTVYSKIIKNKERLTQMQTSKHLNKPYSALVNHIVDYYRIVTVKTAYDSSSIHCLFLSKEG